MTESLTPEPHPCPTINSLLPHGKNGQKLQTLAASGDFGYQPEASSSLKVVYEIASLVKKLTSLISVTTLLIGLLAAIPIGLIAPSTANAVTCNATTGTLVPLHRSSTDAWNSYRPFYADTKDSTTPKSGYVGYVVSGSLVSSVTDLWIGISSFSDATKLTKSSNQSAIIPSRDFFTKSDGANDTTKRLAYFYLYAPNKTNSLQTFTITLYNGNPAIGGTTICSDTDGFSSVNDVISANANKITGVTVSNANPVIGSDFSVTATGQTGTLGRGPTDDRLLVNGNNIGPISLSPAMVDNWTADAFSLIGIKFRYDIDNNGTLTNDAYQYNWLRYYPTSTASKLYDVTYYFTVRAVATNVPVRPVQNIVSGTQVKYTGSYSGSALTASITSIKDKVSINKTVKSVTAVNNPTGDPQFDLVYQLKLRNNATVESTIDYLKDTISINTSSVTGGAFVSPSNGGTLTLENTGSITNLLVKASITTNQLVLNFNGPIALSGLSSNTIEYKVRVSYPSANASMPINNQVIGYIGSETITATSGVNAVNINLKATVTLTIVQSADGYVSTDVLQTNGTACTSNGASADTTCTFYSGTALTLTATSSTGTNTISKWLTTGSTAVGTCTAANAVNPCSFVMLANQTITPVFGQSYVVTVVGAANVDVSDGSATLFSCTSGTCTKTFPAGATPRISFTPAPGFIVNTITTNASSPSAATINSGSTPKNVDLTVNTDIQVTLGVGQTSYVLDVTVLTAGGNTVSSSPSGISLCDSASGTGTCSAAFTTGTSVTLTATAKSAGNPSYSFANWGGDCSGSSTCTLTLNANKTVTASFSSTAKFTVTFNNNSSTFTGATGSASPTSSQQETAGAAVNLASVGTMTLSGYTFTGWATDPFGGPISGTTITPTSDITLYAVWVQDIYSVTYDGNTSDGGTVPSDSLSPYVSGDVVTVLGNSGTLTKTGHTFNNWNTAVNGSGTARAPSATFTISSAVTLYAQWTPNTYTVTYDGNNKTTGTVPSNQTKTYGVNLTLATNSGTLARTGYAFAGWNTQADGLGTTYAVGATYSLNAGITLYAKWTADTYTVTYNGNSNTGGTVPSNQTKTYAVDLTLAANTGTLVRTGYTFDGWYTTSTGTSGTAYAASTGTYSTNAGITLYAKWNPNTYTLTYDANLSITSPPTSGNPPGSVTYTTGSTAITIADNTGTPILTKTGYTFHGWYSNTTGSGGTSYSVGSTLTISQDTTVYAHWILDGAKTVTFNKNDLSGTTGSQSASASTALSSSSALRARTGYNFAGWNTLANGNGTNYLEGDSYSFAADITLYAKWTPVTYAVTYNTNSSTSGTAPSNQSKTHAVDLTLQSNSGTLARTGYTFAGWNTEANGSGTSYAEGATYTTNAILTLYAKWTINTYTVVYNGNSESSGSLPVDASSPYNFNATVTVFGNTGTLAKTGHTFAGWNTAANGTGTSQATASTFTLGAANVTLYAEWTADAPASYTITYATNSSDGGTAPANTTGNGSVTLRTNSGNLTRSGYTFGGWNTATGCSGTNYAAGASFNLTSSVTLYPCWNANSTPTPTPDPEPTPEPQPRNNAPAKVKPVVVWKNPNAIKTTTTLSTTQLNAVATVSTVVTPTIANPTTPDKLPSTAPTIAGTYVYTPILPTVVTAGVNQVTTITSAQNALTGTTKTVPTTTTPSVPTNTPSTTNVEEKPVLGQGTTLAPGLQKMKVVFIPTDSTTYEPVETEVEILVQAETKVNWVEPAPIKKTTPVGPGQLNATGIAPGLSNNVPGTYKYDIPEGTTLAPGKYPVKVTFTPTDPNYLPSTGEVTITVVADINPLPTPIITPANTASVRPITNTTSSATSKVIAVGNGLSAVATSGVQVSVLPQLNFSGKTTVTVSVTDEGETKDVIVPVTVLPLPAVTPLTTPNTKGKSTISWKPSPNATEYEVIVAGKNICTTTATSCSTTTLIGPNSAVQVVAKGNDETVAPVAPAKYAAPKKPVTALVVYFDTNKFNLDAKDKADIRAVAKVIIEQGFKNIVVNGHTDIRGGVDNQVLSRNRSNATFNYLKELVPGLNVTIGAFASTKPAVKGTSAEALASNRRAEVGVF